MKYGYARVSTVSQNLDTQLEALKKEGCDIIIEEKKSGKDLERPELNKLLNELQPGDELIVYDLSRLSRSMKDTISLIEDFNNRGISLISLKDGYDMSQKFAKYFVAMLSMLNEMQRTFQNEKIAEGIANAKSKGVKFGRPRTISNDTINLVHKLYDAKTPYELIVKNLRISRASVAKIIKDYKKTKIQRVETISGIKNELDEMKISPQYLDMKLKDVLNTKAENIKQESINDEVKKKNTFKDVHPNQITIDDILKSEYDNDDYDEEYDSTNFNFGDDDY